jgi:MoaA/NifB/PqqE/SkfB family radical SAM enzyme
MCPRDKFRHPRESMKFQCFKKSVDESVNLGVKYISLTGYGEPLMDNELDEKLKYIKNNYARIKIGITTTGHQLRGDILDSVWKYVDVIRISNYGITKESYERVHRGALKYEKIKENIEALLKRRNQTLAVKRPKIFMAFLDLPENQGDMEIWKSYYEPRVDRIDIWQVLNWAGGYDVNIKFTEKDNIHPCRNVMKLDAITICANGAVSICCNDFNRDLVIGNISEKSLGEILDGDKLKYLQNIHVGGTIFSSSLICKDCDQIRDRSNALIYTSGNMEPGKLSLWAD